jgi:hypothetical protein
VGRKIQFLPVFQYRREILRAIWSNTNPNATSYRLTNSDCNRHVYADTHSHSYVHSNCHGHAYSNAYLTSDCYVLSAACSNAEVSSNPTAASDSAVRRNPLRRSKLDGRGSA